MDAETGLALDPANPYLLCVLGQVEMAEGRTGRRGRLRPGAGASPSLAAAWANRGMLAFETGDLDGAVSDFTHAVEPGRGPRSPLFQPRRGAPRHRTREEAVADLTRALELAPDDEDIRRALAVG